jgi:hypothetical protein
MYERTMREHMFVTIGEVYSSTSTCFVTLADVFEEGWSRRPDLNG